MGYACPVCEDPQADAGHLANHLAFTAMLGDEAHEAWLDEHAPEWGQLGESELADIVAELVDETEFPQVFEDTVGGLEEQPADLEERSGALFGEHQHGHDHSHQHGHRNEQHGHRNERQSGGGAAGSNVDEATAEILEEAREMTREMLDEDADTGGEEATDAGADENE